MNQKTKNNVRVRVLNFSGEVKADNAASPEGVVALVNMGFYRIVGPYICYPRPAVVYAWDSVEGVPEGLAYFHEKYPLGEPPTKLDEVTIEGSFIENPTVIGDPGDMTTVFRSADASNMHLYSLTEGEAVYVALYMTEDAIIIERLGERVVLAIPSSLNRDLRFSIAARWTPTSLGLSVLFPVADGTYSEAYSYADFDQLRLLPSKIIRQLLAQVEEPREPSIESPDALTPRVSYKDANDFLETVLEVLAYMRRQLKKIRPTPFWNHIPIEVGGTKAGKKKWVPKDEPQCGDSLYLNLDSLLTRKNITITPETPSRSGRCDFRLSAPLVDYRSTTLLLELKKAQSDDLLHGLKSQLPTYLDEQGIKLGLYGVLWFKGKYSDKPKDLTLDDCLERLRAESPASVVDVVGFDVAFNESASTKN